MDAITLPHLPAFGERDHYEPVITRLRKMRAKKAHPETGNLLVRARAYARSGRPDWIKGKLRWFSAPDELDRIMANVEVEKSIGRSEPELWSERSTQGYRSEFNIDERGFNRHNKESAEMWKHQIDPMLAEDLYQTPGGKEKARIGPGGEDQEVVVIATEKTSKKRLRLLEVRYTADIVGTATDICQEIAQICQKESPDAEQSLDALPVINTVDVSA